MHASPIVPLLQRWLRHACPAVHAAPAAAVVTVVEALVLGAKLALTHLGRDLRSAAFAKHSIKRVDRPLGKTHLQRDHAPGITPSRVYDLFGDASRGGDGGQRTPREGDPAPPYDGSRRRVAGRRGA